MRCPGSVARIIRGGAKRFTRDQLAARVEDDLAEPLPRDSVVVRHGGRVFFIVQQPRTFCDPDDAGRGGEGSDGIDRGVDRHEVGRQRLEGRLGGEDEAREGEVRAVHPPSTAAIRGPDETTSSDQAGPRHPANSA